MGWGFWGEKQRRVKGFGCAGNREQRRVGTGDESEAE